MNETLKTIHSRAHDPRRLSSKPVSDADLATIVEASVRAANASARQSYSIVTVDGAETISALCSDRASRALIYCLDYEPHLRSSGSSRAATFTSPSR